MNRIEVSADPCIPRTARCHRVHQAVAAVGEQLLPLLSLQLLLLSASVGGDERDLDLPGHGDAPMVAGHT